jgi:hypothetical protein
MIISNNDNNNKKFTIQYTKEELGKIQEDFLQQLSEYISRVNNRIIRTMEEIEKEAAVGGTISTFPTATIIVEQKKVLKS